MNISELISRTNAVAKKYDKYTAVREESKLPKGADAFTALFTELLDRANELNLKGDEISKEKNRATKAVLNAEQRKNKSNLLDLELPKLEKLVRKGKTTPELISDREKKVLQLKETITGIADGVHPARRPGQVSTLGPPKLGLGKGGKPGIELNVSSGAGHRADAADFYTHTDQTKAFQQEWDVAKRRQDKALDNIESGVATLRGIGEAMGETMAQQDVLIDAIDERMDHVIKDLKTNNMKLKGLVQKMGSQRNFCVYIVLLCIALAIALYIYNMVKK